MPDLRFGRARRSSTLDPAVARRVRRAVLRRPAVPSPSPRLRPRRARPASVPGADMARRARSRRHASGTRRRAASDHRLTLARRRRRFVSRAGCWRSAAVARPRFRRIRRSAMPAVHGPCSVCRGRLPEALSGSVAAGRCGASPARAVRSDALTRTICASGRPPPAATSFPISPLHADTALIHEPSPGGLAT